MHSLSHWKPLSCLLITRLLFAPTFKEKFKRRRQEIEMKHKQDIENLKTSLLLCACPSTFFRKLICDFRISFFFAARNSSALSTSAFLSTNHRIPEFSSLGFLQKTRGNSQFLLIGDSENSTVIPNSDTNHIMAENKALLPGW